MPESPFAARWDAYVSDPEVQAARSGYLRSAAGLDDGPRTPWARLRAEQDAEPKVEKRPPRQGREA